MCIRDRITEQYCVSGSQMAASPQWKTCAVSATSGEASTCALPSALASRSGAIPPQPTSMTRAVWRLTTSGFFLQNVRGGGGAVFQAELREDSADVVLDGLW